MDMEEASNPTGTTHWPEVLIACIPSPIDMKDMSWWESTITCYTAFQRVHGVLR
jgi:hypothetical protein